MPLSELTSRDAVLDAIREYDALGQDGFLAKYGYAPARKFQLIQDGKSYDPKAIVGVAFKYQFPERGPLQASEFSGGDATVVPLLRKLNFDVQTIQEEDPSATISANEIQLIGHSKTKRKYDELSVEERDAYQALHEKLQRLGSFVKDNLQQPSNYVVKLTSGFNPNSGIRGYLPKDLWFAVSHQRNYDVLVGMPQLFMIVSEHGIEYGFAASIHPSDFSDQSIKQRVRAAAPQIFEKLPQPASAAAVALQSDLTKTGHWYLRRKTRLNANVQDFTSLDEWLSFLKSPAGAEWAGGAISRYISLYDLETVQPDFVSLMKELATIFSVTMDNVVPSALPENAVQKGFEDFLAAYPSTRSSVEFGKHDELKNKLNLLRSELEALPALRAHPHIRVSWSVGQGNFACVPWIALVDDRETTSIQRGTYCVFLFAENMSGVYLTLNQGVTDTINEKGRIEGRRILGDQAEAVRQIVRQQLRSFSLNNDVDLHTDGALGQDYEASTVAYRYYAKGEVPEDAVLNDHIGESLTGYAQVIQQRPAVQPALAQWWIFQANPKFYDVDAAIHDLTEVTWTVQHGGMRASVGDRVFFWRAGREAGVIGLGTVIEPPTLRENLATEEAYLLDTERLGATRNRVLVRIDQRLNEPLLRTVIAADPRLKDLGILRFANASTFKIPPHHASAILELIENVEEPAVQTAEEAVRRVWVYAPGENAEYWDEFYEAGIMAIGWDALGDLTQYGSPDDLLIALQREYETEGRPTNNARACYDFVHTLRVGDQVFVKRGRNTIIGYGIVTGEYQHIVDRTQFQNVRTVRWESRGTWASPAPLAVKTLTDVTEAASFVTALQNMISGPVSEAPKPIPAAVREPYTVEQAIEGQCWRSAAH
jgi:hypothetical protein